MKSNLSQAWAEWSSSDMRQRFRLDILQVVSYDSATLVGNVPIGIDRDHRAMTRFSAREERGYIMVKGTLIRFLRSFAQEGIFQPGRYRLTL